VSIYLFEIATPGHKGFYTSFQSASQQVAIFVAAIIGFAMSASLTSQQIADGGWRIPFFIGCLIVPLIFVLRRSLQETPEFLSQKKHPSSAEVFSSMAANWQIVLLGMLLVVLTTVSFYLITVYTPTFGKNLNLTEAESLLVTLCVACTNFFWLPVGGAISDRIGRKAVLLTIAILAFATAYPALAWLASSPTFGKLLAVELLFSFYFGVYNGAMVAALSELVPKEVRATCFSLAFSLAAALFGTATPAVSTWLIRETGDKASPGYWLMAAGLCGIVSTLVLYRGGAAVPVRAAASA
jgi:MFS transporter, MHS family, citrate/tricarballylate:H+ symporter